MRRLRQHNIHDKTRNRHTTGNRTTQSQPVHPNIRFSTLHSLTRHPPDIALSQITTCFVNKTQKHCRNEYIYENVEISLTCAETCCCSCWSTPSHRTLLSCLRFLPFCWLLKQKQKFVLDSKDCIITPNFKFKNN
jgi:hypothetical protein